MSPKKKQPTTGKVKYLPLYFVALVIVLLTFFVGYFVGGGKYLSQNINQNLRADLFPDCSKLTYTLGDVNLDGQITREDSELSLNYWAELVELSPEQICAADYDMDGKIEPNDSENILVEAGPEMVFPDCSKLTYTLGDVNNDGSFTKTDIKMVLDYANRLIDLDNSAICAADFNRDSKVTATDARLIASEYNIDLDFPDCSTLNYKIGDVNNDGKITVEDSDLALNYWGQLVELSPEQICAADYDENKNIDPEDAKNIRGLVESEGPCKTILVGDSNGDGVLNENDLFGIVQYINNPTNTTEDICRNDYNIDKTVNNSDFIDLAKHLYSTTKVINGGSRRRDDGVSLNQAQSNVVPINNLSDTSSQNTNTQFIDPNSTIFAKCLNGLMDGSMDDFSFVSCVNSEFISNWIKANLFFWN